MSGTDLNSIFNPSNTPKTGQGSASSAASNAASKREENTPSMFASTYLQDPSKPVEYTDKMLKNLFTPGQTPPQSPPKQNLPAQQQSGNPPAPADPSTANPGNNRQTTTGNTRVSTVPPQNYTSETLSSLFNPSRPVETESPATGTRNTGQSAGANAAIQQNTTVATQNRAASAPAITVRDSSNNGELDAWPAIKNFGKGLIRPFTRIMEMWNESGWLGKAGMLGIGALLVAATILAPQIMIPLGIALGAGASAWNLFEFFRDWWRYTQGEIDGDQFEQSFENLGEGTIEGILAGWGYASRAEAIQQIRRLSDTIRSSRWTRFLGGSREWLATNIQRIQTGVENFVGRVGTWIETTTEGVAGAVATVARTANRVGHRIGGLFENAFFVPARGLWRAGGRLVNAVRRPVTGFLAGARDRVQGWWNRLFNRNQAAAGAAEATVNATAETVAGTQVAIETVGSSSIPRSNPISRAVEGIANTKDRMVSKVRNALDFKKHAQVGVKETLHKVGYDTGAINVFPRRNHVGTLLRSTDLERDGVINMMYVGDGSKVILDCVDDTASVQILTSKTIRRGGLKGFLFGDKQRDHWIPHYAHLVDDPKSMFNGHYIIEIDANTPFKAISGSHVLKAVTNGRGDGVVIEHTTTKGAHQVGRVVRKAIGKEEPAGRAKLASNYRDTHVALGSEGLMVREQILPRLRRACNSIQRARRRQRVGTTFDELNDLQRLFDDKNLYGKAFDMKERERIMEFLNKLHQAYLKAEAAGQRLQPKTRNWEFVKFKLEEFEHRLSLGPIDDTAKGELLKNIP